MSNVIVDTSVIIDHLRGTSPDLQILETLRLEGKIELLVSHMTIIELFAGQDASKKTVRDLYEELLSGVEVVGLTIASAKKAGELIRIYPQIPDPTDFLIAAIALEQSAQIATHNTKHFRQLPGIKLFDFTKVKRIDSKESDN